MYEVEVKVPADLEAVRARLEELDATPVDDVAQEDTYYDAPHRSFPETDEALRIRTERAETGADEVRLTYKGPLVDDASKTREEVETAVASGEKIDTVLTKLGFEPAATVRKDRERFALEEYTITLDSVEDVGEYVEVETEVDDEADLESAREGAYDVLERLGRDPDEQVRTSYLGLLLADDA
ncbi:class IV adenylate cyclase [Natronococcus jeotgali]|uniref:Adenylyl cyclase CyaB n=1 Tax=Natronococcus jeotgali DSM 18795 TaxID=1227498 RepID=L9WVA4_9EURY|nr:class IV adenylate cyclase [Natronococcus jeotgali]ELY53357.1 adenylyl cyclase CyaB [Natronococcus jeotgali DSM 18795]